MTGSFGPPKTVVAAASEISPRALEDIAQWIEQRGLRTPINNIVGYQQLTPQYITGSGGGAAIDTTTSATYVDFIGSPTSSGLRAGSYQIFFSARVKVDAVGNTGSIGLNINSVNPVDVGDLFRFNCTAPTPCAQLFYAKLKGDTSTVKLRWLISGGTATLYEYSMSLLKIGN